MAKSCGTKIDWYSEISKIAKKVYFEGKFDSGELKQDDVLNSISSIIDTAKITDGLNSPKDWIEFVINDFKWDPFDPRKEKTPGYPLPLPPATDDVSAYNLTEVWNGIEARFSPERGRYVIASRDLQPGELVLREKAFGSIVNHDRIKDVCATCKKYCYPDEELKFLTCEQCRSVVWCSQECKDVGFRDYHIWECHYMKRLQVNFRHYSMAMRLVLCNWNQFLKRFIWGERRDENSLYPNEPDEYELITGFEGLNKKQCLEFALISKTLMYILKAGGFIDRLRQEAIEMKNNLLVQLGKTSRQAELTVLLRSIVTYQLLFADEKLSSKLEKFVATTIMEHIMRIKSNCFELNSTLVWERKNPGEAPTIQQNGITPVGTVLFLKTSQINHSCKPNCDFFFTGETQNVRTIDRIKKGEELFITYERVGKSMPDREDRIPHLMRSFGFECFCNFCQGTPEEDLVHQSQDDCDVSPRVVRELDELMDSADGEIEAMRLPQAERRLFAAKALAKKHRQFRRIWEIDDILNVCFGLAGNLIRSSF